MASYPIYQSEPKMLKELARGNAALIYLDKGTVMWKRTLSSIGYTFLSETHPDSVIRELDPETEYMLKLVSTPFVIILLSLLALDRSGKLLAWHLKRRNRYKAVTDKTSAP